MNVCDGTGFTNYPNETEGEYNGFLVIIYKL